MSFLPEELSGSKERFYTGMIISALSRRRGEENSKLTRVLEFPTNDRVPLVQFEG